jgi:phosphoribosyl 1,2-cyclic phosphodiesterase
MLITFYGVRGSIPSPGPDTIKYGGNTSCVHLRLDSGRDLILDAGTGIRKLGKSLARKSSPINILLSHNHWDHIQGYPFFAPIYQPNREINVFVTIDQGEKLLCNLFDQMDGSNFPVRADDLPADTSCKFKGAESELYEKEGINIIRKKLNHPGGGHAFRITEDGMSCAYVTDNELDPPYKAKTSYDDWVKYLHRVDVLIHDAQYTEEDMPHKHGWGHSLISQVRQLAVDAEVGALVMFHHDPDRSDSDLDEIQRVNEKFLKANSTSSHSICAAEGMQVKLSKTVLGGDTHIEIIN